MDHLDRTSDSVCLVGPCEPRLGLNFGRFCFSGSTSGPSDIMQDLRSSTGQLGSLPFDADLVDYILTTLSDIHSLENFVLSSKFIYDVFQTRRISVLRAVVSNHLGPVVPQAMRLLKVMVDAKFYWHGWLAPVPLSKLPKEDDFLPDNFTLTVREARILAANHDTVQELESLYSWR
jgi:hypothetical protein